MHLLQVLTVCSQRVSKALVEAPGSPSRAEPNQSSAGTRSIAIDIAKWWHHQGTIWWGHTYWELGAHVPKSAVQKVIHQYKSHDHIKKNDRKVLPKVSQCQASTISACKWSRWRSSRTKWNKWLRRRTIWARWQANWPTTEASQEGQTKEPTKLEQPRVPVQGDPEALKESRQSKGQGKVSWTQGEILQGILN